MAKPGRPGPGLDDYLYWQERLANREASGLSIDEFCADEDVSRSTYYRDFTESRARDGPAKFLAGFKGYLQADAYGGYDHIFLGSNGSVIEVACWAHTRRNYGTDRTLFLLISGIAAGE